MRVALLAFLGACGLAAQPEPASRIEQKTAGWCAPAVADIKGNVTINCQGVDPKAQARLNELLDLKDLQLTDRIKEAEDWARKYRELLERLESQADDSESAKRAESLIREGQFEEAGRLLDEIIERGEAVVRRTARNHFNRGNLFQLQYQPVKALADLKRAYELDPTEYKYSFSYATLLLEQKQFSKSVPVFLVSLERVRPLAEQNPAAYLPDVAGTLNNLAALYSDTNRMEQAQGGLRRSAGDSPPTGRAEPRGLPARRGWNAEQSGGPLQRHESDGTGPRGPTTKRWRFAANWPSRTPRPTCPT